MKVDLQTIVNRRAHVAWLPLLCFAYITAGSSAQSLTKLIPSAGVEKKTDNGTAEAAAADELNRTTPREAVVNLLEACHADRLIHAARYLDLGKLPSRVRATEGPELANQLCDLLNHNPRFEVRQLATAPEGHRFDELPDDTDALAVFEDEGRQVPLLLQRKNDNGAQIWLVSADSVTRIPELAQHAQESPIEKRLPAFLVQTKFIGTPLWIWLALLLFALVVSFLSRLLVRLLVSALHPLVRRYATSVQSYHLEAFTEPLRLLVSTVVLRAALETLTPSALLRAYLLNLIFLAFVMSSVSLAMRVVDVISDRITSRLDPKQRAVSYSVLLLGVRCVKVLIFCIGVLLVLQEWGYPITTVLAGLGVGGLAVALAAQKTIENLFGGVSVISDRPVLVGDFCQFGGQVGTVEDIGLRSTRIRTLDRTVVTVPNSQFSSMTLENYSRRDRMWFHPAFQLRRDTTAEQITAMMNAIEKILSEEPKVDPTTVPTRFTKIHADGFQVEVFAYVLTANYDEYLRTQTALLLKILGAAEQLKVGFAVPFQESVVRVGTDSATEHPSEPAESRAEHNTDRLAVRD